MWYIFNSGFRSLYLENALRTLFLPPGATNEYRYKFRGNRNQVAAGTHERIKKAKQGEPIAVSFIDRYSTAGYAYHPLRLATLVKVWEEDDYLYIRARLGEFVAPNDPAAFSGRMLKELGREGIAQLKGGNPDDPDDGYYVVSHDSLFETKTDFQWGTSAWSATVERLDQTKVLGSTESDAVVFARAEVIGPSRDKSLTAKLEGKSVGVFRMTQGKLYKLRVAYRFPIQKKQRDAAATMELQSTANVRVLGSTTRAVNGYADRFEILLVSSRYLEDALGSLSARFTSASSSQRLFAPNGADVLVKVREPASYWFKLAVIVLIFGIAGAVVGIPPDKLPTSDWRGLPVWVWLKGTLAVIQAGMLVLMFRLIGKKAV